MPCFQDDETGSRSTLGKLAHFAEEKLTEGEFGQESNCVGILMPLQK
jgi:hypothetical protein